MPFLCKMLNSVGKPNPLYSKPGFPQFKPFLVLFGLPSPDFNGREKNARIVRLDFYGGLF